MCGAETSQVMAPCRDWLKGGRGFNVPENGKLAFAFMVASARCSNGKPQFQDGNALDLQVLKSTARSSVFRPLGALELITGHSRVRPSRPLLRDVVSEIWGTKASAAGQLGDLLPEGLSHQAVTDFHSRVG